MIPLIISLCFEVCSTSLFFSQGNVPFSKEIVHGCFYYMDKFLILVSGQSFFMYKYHLDTDKVDDIKRWAGEKRFFFFFFFSWPLCAYQLHTLGYPRTMKLTFETSRDSNNVSICINVCSLTVQLHSSVKIKIQKFSNYQSAKSKFIWKILKKFEPC